MPDDWPNWRMRCELKNSKYLRQICARALSIFSERFQLKAVFPVSRDKVNIGWYERGAFP